MYEVRKRIEVSIAHRLQLPYLSACNNLHGHNLVITVFCRADTLNKEGMVEDFSSIGALVKSIDHKNINDVFGKPMSAEQLCYWVFENLPTCYRVEIEETSGNVAVYDATIG